MARTHVTKTTTVTTSTITRIVTPQNNAYIIQLGSLAMFLWLISAGYIFQNWDYDGNNQTGKAGLVFYALSVPTLFYWNAANLNGNLDIVGALLAWVEMLVAMAICTDGIRGVWYSDANRWMFAFGWTAWGLWTLMLIWSYVTNQYFWKSRGYFAKNTVHPKMGTQGTFY